MPWVLNVYNVRKKISLFTHIETTKYLRRNPIEDGAISGFSGQKSVPE